MQCNIHLSVVREKKNILSLICDAGKFSLAFFKTCSLERILQIEWESDSGATCHCSNTTRYHGIAFLSGNSSHHSWTVLILTCCTCDCSWPQQDLFRHLMLVAAGCVQLFIYFQNLHRRVIPMAVKRKHQPTSCLFPGVNANLCFRASDGQKIVSEISDWVEYVFIFFSTARRIEKKKNKIKNQGCNEMGVKP